MKAKSFLTACLLCSVATVFVACSQKSAPKNDNTAEAAQDNAPQYIDFEMDTPEGSPIKVSDFVSKNKYTLVDFWASWCGPCHAEMPTVVKAYDNFHSKGLEIIGVSLDSNKNDWVKAIGELNMTWPQMSDLKGWESAGAQLYGVRAIPTNVLINQDGKVVAHDLRGEGLLRKLAELMD